VSPAAFNIGTTCGRKRGWLMPTIIAVVSSVHSSRAGERRGGLSGFAVGIVFSAPAGSLDLPVVVGKMMVWTAVVLLFRYPLRMALLVGGGPDPDREFS
jgi:hypothetical protein